MATGRYQLLPPLADDERQALRGSIESVGILQPITVDEHGEIIDGHHRAAIAAELGIECPSVVLDGLTDDEKNERALLLNLTRRHLTSRQKRDVIHAELIRNPDRSDRAIAGLVGVDHKTVGLVRRGEIPHELDTLAAASEGLDDLWIHEARIEAIRREFVDRWEFMSSRGPLIAATWVPELGWEYAGHRSFDEWWPAMAEGWRINCELATLFGLTPTPATVNDAIAKARR